MGSFLRETRGKSDPFVRALWSIWSVWCQPYHSFSLSTAAVPQVSRAAGGWEALVPGRLVQVLEFDP